MVLTVCLAAVLVAGCGSGEDESSAGEGGKKADVAVERVEQDALEKYRWYLERKATLLADWTKQLQGQIVVGEAGKAQSRYATSRVQYSHLLPVPLLFPSLDMRINGQAGDSSDGEFVGFHRIERTLFGQESTAGLKPLAKGLVADVQRLKHAVKTAELSPAEIAEAAGQLTEEVVNVKIAGKEEPVSDTDMVDVSASVEGAERAFEALRPLLASSDPELVGTIESQFVEAYDRLAETGTPARQPQAREPAAGAIMFQYSGMSPAEVRNVAKPLEGLSELFARIPRKLPESDASTAELSD